MEMLEGPVDNGLSKPFGEWVRMTDRSLRMIIKQGRIILHDEAKNMGVNY